MTVENRKLYYFQDFVFVLQPSSLESLSLIDFTELTESNVLFTISFGEILNLLIIKSVKSLRVRASNPHYPLAYPLLAYPLSKALST